MYCMCVVVCRVYGTTVEEDYEEPEIITEPVIDDADFQADPVPSENTEPTNLFSSATGRISSSLSMLSTESWLDKVADVLYRFKYNIKFTFIT